MKHVPFQSIYRTNFEVVEERDGRFSLYPHHSQLPVLLRALNLEFYGALPGRLARADGRADGFHKLALKCAALLFCGCINGARKDALRLYALANGELVSKIAIVQQITESTRGGLHHRFRFYAGEDFCPDIHLNGKSMVFTEHVLQRFTARVPNNLGEDVTQLLLAVYGSPHVAMGVGPGQALVVPYGGSVLAFTFEETEREFIFTTCLTMKEMNSLRRDMPPRALNLHYGAAFQRPQIRHWLPTQWMQERYKCWERKVPLPPPRDPGKKPLNWHLVANWVRDRTRQLGHGPTSQLLFLDNIPGPCLTTLLPGQAEPRVNELEFYQEKFPQYDWDTIFAELEAKDKGGKPSAGGPAPPPSGKELG